MKAIDYPATLEGKIIFELQELARLDERREVALARLAKYRRALYGELYGLDVECNGEVPRLSTTPTPCECECHARGRELVAA